MIKNQTIGDKIFSIFPPPQFLQMPAVALDISDTSVRFLELIKTKRGYKLGKYGNQDIPEGIMVNGKIERRDDFVKVFGELVAKHKLNFVRVSLPEEHAYFFQTKVAHESNTEGDLRSIVEFQLEENVPIPSQDAVFDYEIIAEYSDEIFVNVAAYGAKMVDDYDEALRASGLLPVSFEVEAQAVTRSVIDDKKGTYMIVDFGKKRTGIAIVACGLSRFTSTVSVGSDLITSAILKHMKVDEIMVDEIKNNQGLVCQEESKELFEALIGSVSALKDEIKRHCMYWNTRIDKSDCARKIDKIILCGGGANLAGLPEYLSFGLEIPVELANVWANALSFEDTIPEISFRKSLSYATAVGLALKK